jgi:hypothetical protein
VALSRIRAAEWETEAYWRDRISGYLEGTLNPQQALEPRALFVAIDGETVVGFVAGHCLGALAVPVSSNGSTSRRLIAARVWDPPCFE